MSDKKKYRKKRKKKVNFSPIPMLHAENILTCLTLHFGTSIWNSKHLDGSVCQIISNIQGAGMLSACPTHTAAQQLKTGSIHVPVLPEHKFCKHSHTDNLFLCKT